MVGGYGNGLSRNVKNTKLPATIKCNQCEHIIPSRFFADRKLDVLKKFMADNKDFDASTQSYISCKGCGLAQQKTEARCVNCKATKVKDAFNNTQFKSDDPKCKSCAAQDSDDDDSSSSGGNLSGEEAGTLSGPSTKGNSQGPSSRAAGGGELDNGDDITAEKVEDSDEDSPVDGHVSL